MAGCVQRQPHSIGLTTLSSNQTGKSTSDDKIQKILRDPAPIIKPISHPSQLDDSNSTSGSSVHLSEMNSGLWTLILSGQDAKQLDQLLEYVPYRNGQDGSGYWNKLGVNYYCTQFQETICVFNLGIEDGSLFEIPESSRERSANAECVINEPYVSENLELDPVQKGKSGRLLISGGEAQKIYEGLTVSAVALADSGSENHRTEKNGKQISCTRYISQVKSDFQYRCRSSLNYDSGKFDEITVSR